MRSTVRIDDTLLEELRSRATKERVSLTRALNEALRAGLTPALSRRLRKPYRETTASLGEPLIDVRHAHALAARLEDDEFVRKLSLRK